MTDQENKKLIHNILGDAMEQIQDIDLPGTLKAFVLLKLDWLWCLVGEVEPIGPFVGPKREIKQQERIH